MPRIPTRRIPLYRQPPVYLVGAVVLAALLPLLLPVLGVPVGPGVVSAEAADSTTKTRSVPAPSAVPMAVASASPVSTEPAPSATIDPDVAVAWLETPPIDNPSIIDEADEPGAVASSARPDAPHAARTRVGATTRAKVACRKGDKKAARTAYRAIPFGDERRREIRRACRRQGIWIL